MNVKIFTYRGLFKFSAIALPLLGICTALILLLSFIIGSIRAIFNGIELENIVSFTIPGVIIPCLFIYGSLTIHAMYPTIYFNDVGLKIETWLFKSDWISWDALEEIKKPFPKILGIKANGLPKIYYFVGVTQRLGGSGFFISKKIQHYEQLLELLEEKRPDLFAK